MLTKARGGLGLGNHFTDLLRFGAVRRTKSRVYESQGADTSAWWAGQQLLTAIVAQPTCSQQFYSLAEVWCGAQNHEFGLEDIQHAKSQATVNPEP